MADRARVRSQRLARTAAPRLEFPDDVAARSVDDSFMLGSDLLVVPVFDDGTAPVRRRFYLPEGRWTDLLDGKVHDGPGFREVDVPLDRIPVLVRDGAVIPRVEVGPEVASSADLADRPWTLHTYGDAGPAVGLVGFDGTRVTVDLQAAPAGLLGNIVGHDA
jgi:alpha-D-xyloside xylohydrolase